MLRMSRTDKLESRWNANATPWTSFVSDKGSVLSEMADAIAHDSAAGRTGLVRNQLMFVDGYSPSSVKPENSKAFTADYFESNVPG